MNAALLNLETLLSGRKAVDIGLKESLTRPEIASRRLAIYCLGAIDDVAKLIEVLGDENTEHWIDREAAVYTLRRWISRSAAQGKELFHKHMEMDLEQAYAYATAYMAGAVKREDAKLGIDAFVNKQGLPEWKGR